MALDEHYICQRAANAIISEIGPFRVSTDALQAINQFLDEFIVLLLTCSLSLDLSPIKAVVVSLLPSSLGKNAIVEAELEVKTFTETEAIDYELYERMRNLGTNNERFPLDIAMPLLREKCFEYCTLADKDDQLHLQRSIQKRGEKNAKVVISPIVAIYVTTVMEHIAEYLLTAVAMTAEHEDTDYVRVKEVFLALIDDIQLGDVFNRMDLHDKMEKRAGMALKPRASYMPPASPIPGKGLSTQQETGSFLDITFDDLDLDYFDDSPRKSTLTVPQNDTRPQSAMSNFSISSNNRKSTYHLFKNNRNSFHGDALPRSESPVASAYDPDVPNLNFDELIKSGGTVKVSLTPNRLRSIEIKDQTKEDLAPPTWERRATASPRLSAANLSRPGTPSSLSRPVTPLGRQNTNNSAKSSKKSADLLDSALQDYQKTQQSITIEVPKISNRPQTPSSPLSKLSFTVNDKNRFENPREAPAPPVKNVTPLEPLSPKMTSSKSIPPTKVTSPKMSAADRPSISSDISSIKISSPVLSPKLAPASPMSSSPSLSTSALSNTSKSSSSLSLTSSIQEPPLPVPSKVQHTTSTPIVIRRSSMSNKKSRDNLRRAKEAKETKEVSTPKEEAPVVKAPEEVVTVAPQESKLKEEIITYVEEPLPIAQAAPTPVPEEVHVEESAAQKAHASALEKLQQNKIEQLTSPSHSSLATSASNESVKQVQFATEEDKVDLIKPQVEITGPERPSSMVAKRASMVGNRRRSLHESYAADKYNQDMQRHGANKTAGLVSNSIKQWDDILKPEESVIPPASHRRSLLRQLRQEQEQPEEVPDKSNAVLDKVLKFERASSLDDAVHQKVSHMPRRERFLYLQQDPSAIERKSTIAAAKKKLTTRRVAVDQAVQTDPIEVQEDIKSDDDKSDAKSVEEEGIVDGDEEWFLQDDEWDEQEETAIVEWLLCD